MVPKYNNKNISKVSVNRSVSTFVRQKPGLSEGRDDASLINHTNTMEAISSLPCVRTYPRKIRTKAVIIQSLQSVAQMSEIFLDPSALLVQKTSIGQQVSVTRELLQEVKISSAIDRYNERFDCSFHFNEREARMLT